MSGEQRGRRVSDEEIAATSAQIASALAGVAAAVESLQSELAHRQADVARRAAETDRYKTDLDAIMASTAWRLTAVPRRLVSRWPRAMRGGLRKAARGLWWAATPWRTPERLRFFEQAASEAAVAGAGAAPAAAPAAPSPDAAYRYWIEAYEPLQPRSPPPKATSRAPRVSFLLTGADPERVLRTVSSLGRQTSGDWELVSATAAGAAGPKARIRIVPQAAGLDRAAVLAVLAGQATGEWIAVLDAGDTLAPDAVAEIAAAVAQSPKAAIVYSDEDEAQADGARLNPYFKPSWSPQLLQAFNYFGRLTVLSRALLAEMGGFLADDTAAVEWSANLRVADAAGARGRDIVRLTRVACHRFAGGERERPRPATPAAAQNRAMLQRYWARKGHDARIETTFSGVQHATWTIQAPPLVSIIIPSHNQVELIRRCINGILYNTDYDNLEVIIVENNSRDQATWDFYDEMKAEPRVRIVRRDGKFNYSRVCNYGAAEARGSLLLFLNNDVEVVHTDWLAELVRVAGLPEVGVVGAKLRYPNGVLQHAGVVAGVHLFGLAYHSCDEHVWGAFGSPAHPRNWLAIMGACQMVRQEVFDLVGGFDEAYDIANSDVALCVKAHLAGWRTAYTPFADLVHYEGLTRGHTNPPGDMIRSARLLEQVGMAVDPYLHPGLSGMDGAFRLRASGEPSLQEMMRINIGNTVGQTVLDTQPLDLFDDLAVARACGLETSQMVWPAQDAALISNTWSAARWVIDLLRRRSEVRLRFPRALTEGPAGAFGRWIAEEGAAEYRLNATALAAIAALLEGDPGARAFATLVAREDVRSANPLALLPPGRRDLARWLFREAQDAYSLRLEDIWWFLLSIAERPGKEVEQSFLMTPDWQDAFPDALTIFGKDRFSAWFRDRYYLGADDTWLAAFDPTHSLPADQQLRLAYAADARWRSAHPGAFSSTASARALLEWLASAAGLDEACRRWCAQRLHDGTAEALATCGVNVAGHFCYPSGLKISVESLTNGVEAVGGKATRRNIRVAPSDEPRQSRFMGLEPYDVTVFHIQPEPFFPERYARAMWAPRKPDPYKVAYWYWELESVPPYWTELANSVDEVWAATNFVADALRPITHRPVKTLFPGLELGPFKPRPLQAFGLDDRPRFTFLFSFHMASIMERKNPLGLIAAFKRAFRTDEPVALILKTTSEAGHAGNITQLRSAVGDANIEIFDKTLNPDETLSLMDACDAYVSLHRSEGLGLTMAEAMLLGKPVVATRYSGNLDFMSDTNSLLVDYRMKPVGLATPPYDPEGVWADPSVEHAAHSMRRLYDDRSFARALGERARRDAAANLSISAAGERVMARLAEIKAARPPADLLRRPDAA